MTSYFMYNIGTRVWFILDNLRFNGRLGMVRNARMHTRYTLISTYKTCYESCLKKKL